MKRLEAELERHKKQAYEVVQMQEEIEARICSTKRLETELDRQKKQAGEAEQMRVELEARLNDIVSSLEARINILSNKKVRTPISLAQVLDLSPHSTKQVTRGSKRGIFRTNKLTDATPTGKRERFLDNIVQSLKPIIMKICSIPKFRGDKPDVRGVCKLILSSVVKHSKRLFSDRVRPKVETSTSVLSPRTQGDVVTGVSAGDITTTWCRGSQFKSLTPTHHPCMYHRQTPTQITHPHQSPISGGRECKR